MLTLFGLIGEIDSNPQEIIVKVFPIMEHVIFSWYRSGKNIW